MIPYNPIDGNFMMRRFKEIFPDSEQFYEEWTATNYNTLNGVEVLTPEALALTYSLLYSRYGNSTIASFDENQFKYKLFSTIFMYGPAWQKRLEIQKNLMDLDEEDIIKGTTAIHNNALNPSTAPSTQALEELNYISSQNTTKYKKSKIEGYATLYALIETDVTEEFIGKFKKLFITIVEPDLPLWYATQGDN